MKTRLPTQPSSQATVRRDQACQYRRSALVRRRASSLSADDGLADWPPHGMAVILYQVEATGSLAFQPLVAWAQCLNSCGSDAPSFSAGFALLNQLL